MQSQSQYRSTSYYLSLTATLQINLLLSGKYVFWIALIVIVKQCSDYSTVHGQEEKMGEQGSPHRLAHLLSNSITQSG